MTVNPFAASCQVLPQLSFSTVDCTAFALLLASVKRTSDTRILCNGVHWHALSPIVEFTAVLAMPNEGDHLIGASRSSVRYTVGRETVKSSARSAMV